MRMTRLVLAAGVLACSENTAPGFDESRPGVFVRSPAATIALGSEFRVDAVATGPDSAQVAWPEFAWSSSDTNVVVVDETGLSVAVGLGSAFVSAVFEGLRDSVRITVSIERADGGVDFATSATGFFQHCAIASDGRPFCLGETTFEPLPGDLALASLHVSTSHKCGLTEDGVLHCWGSNASGQFMTGAVSAENATAPVQGGGTRRFSAITVGHASTILGSTCGIDRADGLVYCAGYNQSGQLGRPASGSADPAVAPFAQTMRPTSIALEGGGYGCLTDPELTSCWGTVVNRGVSGVGPNNPGALRVIPNGTNVLQSVVTSPSHACGLDAVSFAHCWGDNTQGQLGHGDIDAVSHPIMAPVTGDHRFRMLSVAAGYTCGITLAGDLVCWGAVPNAIAARRGASRATPYTVAEGMNLVSVSTTPASICVIDADGRAYCF